jgi:membrane protein DedA with SNARE-associated domain
MSRAEALFLRWGALFAFFGRLIPGVRTFVAIPAGVARMSFPKFAFYTFVGAYVWSTAVIGFGYFMGQEWWRIKEVLAVLTPWLVAAGIIAGGILLIWRIYRRRKYA